MALIPSPAHPFTDPHGRITSPWYLYLQTLSSQGGGGGGPAPGDADYVLTGADSDLPNARVLTDSPSVDFDLGTPGQVKAHVIVDAAGALDGGASADLKVRVDGTTIDINGSNELEVIAAARQWVPLALGSEPLEFVSDGAGQPILVTYP